MTHTSRITNGTFRKLRLELPYFLLNAVLLTLLHGTNLYDSDEGVILNGAWNLFNGRSLYGDFFEYVPPGSFYLVYATWLLTGAHYWSAQLIGIACLLLGAAGVQAIAGLVLRASRLEVPEWSVRIAPLLFCVSSAVWPAINHNSFSIVTVIWVTCFLVRAVGTRSSPDNLVAGFLAGLAFAFLQHRALVVIGAAVGAYVLLWLRDRRMPWLGYGLHFVLASLVVPAGLLIAFSPAVLFENLYLFPAANYQHVNWVNPAPLLVAFAAGAWVLWYLRGEWNDLIALLAVQQAALLASALARPDVSHVVAVIFPMLCLLPLVVGQYVRNRPGSIFKVSSAPFWITAVMLLGSAALRAVIFSPGAEPKAIAYVRENCTASPYLFAGPFIPGFYFETRKLNATRYSVLITGLNTEVQFRDALADLSDRRVPCVVMNYNMVSKFGYDRANPIDSYLDENYRLVLDDAGFRVLKRIGEP